MGSITGEPDSLTGRGILSSRKGMLPSDFDTIKVFYATDGVTTKCRSKVAGLGTWISSRDWRLSSRTKGGCRLQRRDELEARAA